jgi:hypothetical protein
MTTSQIIKELGIEQSDEAFKAKIISKIIATADLRFARTVDEIMTDEQHREFEEYSEGKDPQDIASWVEGKYEGSGAMYDTIIESIVTDLKHGNQQTL